MTTAKRAPVSRGHLYAQKSDDGTWYAWTMWERKAVATLENVTLRHVKAYARRERYELMLL